jgi:hypothetical protein
LDESLADGMGYLMGFGMDLKIRTRFFPQESESLALRQAPNEISKPKFGKIPIDL